eukprot:COSAG05_NODE_2584_length_2873_cov_6.100216_2_plen_78_part_00
MATRVIQDSDGNDGERSSRAKLPPLPDAITDTRDTKYGVLYIIQYSALHSSIKSASEIECVLEEIQPATASWVCACR